MADVYCEVHQRIVIKAVVPLLLILTMLTLGFALPTALTNSNNSHHSIALSGQNVNGVINETYEWKFTSPQGMVQNVGYDSYVKDGLTFKISGWNYSASVSDSSNNLAITPMRDGILPINDMQGQGVRLNWIMTPMSDIFQDPITWPGSGNALITDSGYTIYDLLQNGVLDVYYANVSSGTLFVLSGSSQLTRVNPTIFMLGDIRVRVLNGTSVLNGAELMIKPSSKTIHFVVYARSIFDSAKIDALGAITSQAPGEVVESSGFTTQKSMKIVIPSLNISEYIAIDPATPATKGLLLQDDSLYITDASGKVNGDWALTFGTISKANLDSIRNLQFYGIPGLFESQTFDFYLSTALGSDSFVSVGRITQPYSISYYPHSDVYMYYFPQTQDDGSKMATCQTQLQQTLFSRFRIQARHSSLQKISKQIATFSKRVKVKIAWT